MIKVKDVHFAFPASDFALTIHELHIQPCEHVAIVGPSGSGKTTLLNLIAGILAVGRGSIAIDGVNMNGLSSAQRRSLRLERIGMVFQTFELLEYLSVLDNILLPCRIGSVFQLNKELRDHAINLANVTGLDNKLNRRPRALSQGERQRTAICRALLGKPKIILADEATGNLDPVNKRLVLDLLFQQARLNDAAVLAVTHDHDLLSAFDRTIDFNDFLTAQQ